MAKIPSLSEELQKCERDYVEFLLGYSGGDVRECLKIAKVDADAWTRLLNKHRLVEKAVAKAEADNLSKSARIKLACGKSGAFFNDILEQVGGPRTSLSTYLSQLCKAGGGLKRDGKHARHYKYLVVK